MKFNKWSLERIVYSHKRLTSRKTRTDPKDDPDIDWASDHPLPWWFIKRYLWQHEGAESPEELQEVIDRILARRCRVWDLEEFYVHIISDSCVERTREEAGEEDYSYEDGVQDGLEAPIPGMVEEALKEDKREEATKTKQVLVIIECAEEDAWEVEMLAKSIESACPLRREPIEDKREEGEGQ